MRLAHASCCLVLVLCACGPAPAEPAEGAGVAPADASATAGVPVADAGPGSALADLRTSVAALAERREHDVKYVRVQHVLIGVKGARGLDTQRSAAEAEQLAAEIFRRAQDGEAFRQLMRESDDIGPGEYAITSANRANFAKGFTDTAWRLYPGEIGVCPYDEQDAPFGYHVMLRML